jgi:hypothetical protein
LVAKEAAKTVRSIEGTLRSPKIFIAAQRAMQNQVVDHTEFNSVQQDHQDAR